LFQRQSEGRIPASVKNFNYPRASTQKPKAHA
jgi:hypothetical protein